MLGKHLKILQRLRARFGRGKVAPQQSQQEAAASAPPAAFFVASYLRGNKGPDQELAFLEAVGRVCEAWKKKGFTTLPFSKEQALEEIKEIMEDTFFNLTPAFVQAMDAVRRLSQFQPRMGEEIRSSIVAWALRLVLSGSPGHSDPQRQSLQDKGEEALAGMLRELLREEQTAGHLVGLLENVAYWMHSSCGPVRSRAASLTSSLLHFATQLPSFKMDDNPALGHLVVQLAVSLVDPQRNIRAQTRETLGQLHRLLLGQQGLPSNIKEPRWEVDPGPLWKEGYLQLIAVGEVFWVHLTPQQRAVFAETAWGNIAHLAQEWVREGSLILLSSLLGRVQELLEEEEEDDVKANLSALLYNLWKGREVPCEIGALLPKTDDLE